MNKQNKIIKVAHNLQYPPSLNKRHSPSHDCQYYLKRKPVTDGRKFHCVLNVLSAIKITFTVFLIV